MPDQRDEYLASVARALDASPAVESDVTAELATHIEEATEAGIARGFDPADAERRVLRRLGDPRRLGRSLRRARAGRRDLLALAGGGAVTFGGFTIFGAVLGYAVLLAVVGFAWAGAGLTYGKVPESYAGFAAFAIGATYAAGITPPSIAGWLPWSGRRVRRTVAALIVAAGLPIVLLLPHQFLDPWLAAAYPAVPLAAAVAALRAPDRLRYWPRSVTLASAAVVLLLPFVAWSGAGPSVDLELPVTNSPAMGAPLTRGDSPLESGQFGYALTNDWTADAIFTADTDWSDLAIEFWPLSEAANGSWYAGSAPVAGFAARPEGGALQAHAVAPTARTPTWLAAVVVGTSPTGVRTILSGPDYSRAPSWRGSVLDWWLGR